MPAPRRARAVFLGAEKATRGDEIGVELRFRLERSRLDVDVLDDFAALGPEHCIPSVAGLGKVLRILRASRIAAPEDPTVLIGDIEPALRLLERAVGTPMALELKPRARLRFVAWTDEQVEIIENVAEVIETADTYLVHRRGGRFPVRIPRDNVVRQVTETERWYEILSIDRPS
jgi:hypothetical protein